MTRQISKVQQVAQALNERGKVIRREGDVPRFHNDLTIDVCGKTMRLEYDGDFEFAEVVDGLLVAHFDRTSYRFRQDQLSHIRVD